MKVLGEPGVLIRSERFFSTPSATARRLFFYVTRCGHYYCDAQYDFVDSCAVGKLDSHKNYFLMYIRTGAMHFETDTASFRAEQGQVALVNCREPHHFFANAPVETLWIHFDGANACDFFEQIVAFHGRQCFFPPSAQHIEQQMAQIISGLRSATMTEVECSQRIYRILCALLFLPQQAGGTAEGDVVASAICYIDANLFEDITVERIASAVNLSPSHFSRLFRSTTGFSPHEYIVLHRIDEAKALLHSTGLSVKEIAFRVGYHSEVNFIASFTSKVGVSPTAFRKSAF